MKKIPARIGWETIIICLLLFVFPLSGWSLEGFLIILATNIFMFIILFGIRYYIDENYLLIKGILSKTIKIDVHKIRKIEKTNNLITSPAPSIMGRIEIYYEGESIVISPKNYEDFKNEMLKINPNITFKE